MADHSLPIADADSVLTPERIAKLRQVHAEATPGLWRWGANEAGYVWVGNDTSLIVDLLSSATGHDQADADLIVAAVNALPALLDAVEGVRDFADRLIRQSGQHPEVVTADVVWTLRQILVGGPDLPGSPSVSDASTEADQ